MSFINDLKKIKQDGVPVCIYTDRLEQDAFSFGYVVCMDDIFVYVNHIDPDGIQDGIITRRLEDIFKLEYGGDYEKKVERLYRLKEQRHDRYIDENETDIFLSLLNAAMEKCLVISISTGDHGNAAEYTGFIQKSEENKVYIETLSLDGKDEGTSIIQISDIFRCNCDSIYERDILLLYRDQKNNRR